MVSDVINSRLDVIGKIRDSQANARPEQDPFLYYLPELLTSDQLLSINPAQALAFAKLALEHKEMPVVADALKILNQLVSTDTGTLLPVSRSFFHENRSFLWQEMGTHTSTTDVVTHIINKTLFLSSLGT